MSLNENFDRALDPHRDQEFADAAVEIAAKLRARGVLLTGHETGEQLGDLLDAVERWESAVERAGGDLYVDEGGDQPDNPVFALPRRERDEPVMAYMGRIDTAITAVKNRAD
jgi:hypothetical protein